MGLLSSCHDFICYCVTSQSGTNHKEEGSSFTALSHISCVLKWSGTCASMYGLLRTASLYISFLLKWSGTYFITMPNKISWNIILNNTSFILIYTISPGQGSNFMVLRFHNHHSQTHHQNLSCWLYAQQLIQAPDNYQTYTRKDILVQSFDL